MIVPGGEHGGVLAEFAEVFDGFEFLVFFLQDVHVLSVAVDVVAEEDEDISLLFEDGIEDGLGFVARVVAGAEGDTRDRFFGVDFAGSLCVESAAGCEGAKRKSNFILHRCYRRSLLFGGRALGGGERVIEDRLATLGDDVVEGKGFLLVLHQFGDPLGAPADVHRFIDDIVEDGFGRGVVIELDVVFVGLVLEGEGVLLDDISEHGVAPHGIVELAPSVVADKLGELVNLVTELADTLFAHLAVAAFVVTMAGDVVVELPVHPFDFPEDGAEGFCGLHFHGVRNELPESVGFFVVDGGAFESLDLDFEAGVAFCFAEGKSRGISGRRGGEFDRGIPAGDGSGRFDEFAGEGGPAVNEVLVAFFGRDLLEVGFGLFDLGFFARSGAGEDVDGWGVPGGVRFGKVSSVGCSEGLFDAEIDSSDELEIVLRAGENPDRGKDGVCDRGAVWPIDS